MAQMGCQMGCQMWWYPGSDPRSELWSADRRQLARRLSRSPHRGAAIATRVCLALIATMATTGCSGLYSMHTEGERMQRGCSHAMACSPRGWVPAEVMQPTLPPPQMGWYPVRRGWGEHPPYGTPSRLLSLLRYAVHPLRIPSMRYREVLQGIYTLCYSLYGLHAALYTLHHVVYHWYSTKGIAT